MVQKSLRILVSGLAAGILGTVLVWALTHVGILSPFFQKMELTSSDWRMRQLNETPQRPLETVVIVAVDGRSIDKLGPFSQWPRTYWATILRYLKQGEARLSALDILFDESRRFPDEDEILLQALRETGNVVTSLVLSPADPDNFLPEMTAPPAGLPTDRLTLDIPDPLFSQLPAFSRLGPDFVDLHQAAVGAGFVNLLSDQDGVLRKVPLLLRFNDQVYPSLALAMAIRSLKVASIDYLPEKSALRLNTPEGGRLVPVDRRGRLSVYYHGPYQSFRYISFDDLLSGGENHHQSGFLNYFKDKTVLLGATAPGLFDFKATPLQPGLPGVEVHANVFTQLLNNRFILEWPRQKQWLYVLSWALFTGVLMALLRPIAGAITTVFLMLLSLTLAWLAFDIDKLLLPVLPPVLGIVLTAILQYSYRFRVAEADKRRLKKLFSKYIPAPVMKTLSEKPELVKLGGEKKKCTVLFSDLVGLSGISENMPSETLVKMLNEYFTLMTGIIHQHGGTLDKYTGDGLMAIFGAPVATENAAAEACGAALAMEAAMETLGADWRERQLPVPAHRIGLNSGEMIVGNMGSDTLFDYTAIGDAVNIAARLEQANDLYGTAILIGEDTFRQAGDTVVVRLLDRLRLEGRLQPLNVFELLATRDDPLDIKTREILSHFQKGYHLYLDKQWELAANSFRQALQINGDDQPSRLYVLRCQECLQNPPGDRWDGVYNYQSK